MYTLIDYIKYYSDTTLDELKWNNMDNTLCALLAYIDVNSFSSIKSLKNITTLVLNKEEEHKKEIIYPFLCEALRIMSKSQRYKNMKFSNYINYRNENTQFGALTIIIGKIKVIAFKGTDSSVIGWIENFRLAYDFPTFTQNLAVNYLNDNIGFFDKNVYVVGHSKGGNLAMASSMLTSKFSKIKGILNLDGPGFRKNEFNSLRYKKMKSKLITLVPKNSTIGVLMNNKDYKVVETVINPKLEHYPIYWNIFGSMFVESKLSKVSEEINLITSESSLDEERLKNVMESAFFKYKDKYDNNFGLTDMIKILNDIRTKDKEIYKYLYNVSNKTSKANKKAR